MSVKAEGQESGETTQAGVQGVTDSLPAFFPTISRAPPSENRPIRKLNGSDDLLTRLHLVPLYNATVRQFLRHAPERPVPALNGQHEAGSNVKSGAAASDGQSHVDADPGFEIIEMRGAKRPREDDMSPNRTGQDPGHSSSGAANASKRKGMPKTIENYVADLPGRVMPPKKLLSRPDFHEQTMREIIYRPETTIQNIVPFDRETLESAFRVSAGEVPGIDPALLEPDQTESSSPRKKRKSKTKHKPNKA
ncbi:hypothetical protein OC846_000387 [Tilletia horrida]|uniref:Mediator of RNA polymerase II transcription subunit 19 n=1 Tax=Tilletia horrida TaxID=155126 RepID=A0AAN6GX64_9BASI|nr:hypothetical protein OC845_000025 [Tilletia horrida]KAK0557599.1 hypothetical protein OC846_000387 [Tilletia horrida]